MVRVIFLVIFQSHLCFQNFMVPSSRRCPRPRIGSWCLTSTEFQFGKNWNTAHMTRGSTGHVSVVLTWPTAQDFPHNMGTSLNLASAPLSCLSWCWRGRDPSPRLIHCPKGRTTGRMMSMFPATGFCCDLSCSHQAWTPLMSPQWATAGNSLALWFHRYWGHNDEVNTGQRWPCLSLGWKIAYSSTMLRTICAILGCAPPVHQVISMPMHILCTLSTIT